MNLWEGFLTALGFGAISALTFIAYKHPKGYERMHWPIQAAAMLIFIGVVSFDLGRMDGISDTVAANDSPDRIGFIKRPEGGLNFLIAMPVFLGVNFYLAFLGSLQPILGIDAEEKQKEKPKPKSKEPDE